ncbi:hypothetical protein SAMN04488527_1693 [Aliiroseovarius crassostreae]|uniref:Uncharacterized protein n=1 Tax=Aliiroseovarius crassostreae TaxID=154981 RepID=A0A0P7KQC2_9RHOB|nr:hypothetical protein [Aliiroseovarius crassostreae]KPN64648.1 hypothetical protein AKJ29_00885 [Aliiroseovarius crassostreae]SFU98412.1 hypothetical protein SAMN04488527_1693 [Aliiroseovarius crassostreae]
MTEDDFTDYEKIPPDVGESAFAYCRRLEEDGHEEMFIRKALAHHLEFPIEGMAAFFNQFEMARLRHLTLLKSIHPNRTRFSLTRKFSKNLGISEELAEKWIDRFEEAGGIEYKN